MSYKAITIYTPEGSEPHITAADDAFIHHSLAGGRSGVLGQLECTRVDDTTVRLGGGGASNRGYVIYIPEGSSCDLTVDIGTQSLQRYDLVAAEFTKGGDGTADTHVLRIIKGTASAQPTDPQLTADYPIAAGDVCQLALFRVVLSGLAIERIEPVAPVLNTAAYIQCPGVAMVTPQTAVITKVAVSAAGALSAGGGLSVQDGAVRCEVDGVVEVCGSVYMQGSSSGSHYFGCYVRHNEAELTPGIRPAVMHGAVTTPCQYVAVSAGDVLTLCCRTNLADGVCGGGNDATWLRVRYI